MEWWPLQVGRNGELIVEGLAHVFTLWVRFFFVNWERWWIHSSLGSLGALEKRTFSGMK